MNDQCPESKANLVYNRFNLMKVVEADILHVSSGIMSYNVGR
jgi:hypothetical protein